MNRIEIIKGDITKLRFDAIVNSANKSLLRGGGVDGAIHKAAGVELEQECIELYGCKTGQAKITKSYNLFNHGVSWVIHAVGPRWFDGNYNEEELLRNAYKRALQLLIDYKTVYPEQCLKVLDKYIVEISEEEKKKLRNEVYNTAKQYVEENPIKTVAFPSISTGIYNFPLEKAIPVVLSEIEKFLDKNTQIKKIAVVCFDDRTYECYSNTLNL